MGSLLSQPLRMSLPSLWHFNQIAGNLKSSLPLIFCSFQILSWQRLCLPSGHLQAPLQPRSSHLLLDAAHHFSLSDLGGFSTSDVQGSLKHFFSFLFFLKHLCAQSLLCLLSADKSELLCLHSSQLAWSSRRRLQLCLSLLLTHPLFQPR